MATHITKGVKETEALGERLAAQLPAGAVVAFTGGLGAGKTAFCRGMARGLGCEGQASSPTYAIVNLYPGPQPMAHFDLYRLTRAEDLDTAGFFDYLDEGAVLAVEWSENLSLPVQPDVRVGMETLGGDRREITIEGAEGL